jgi:aspartyl-tRNA(Asn)/glutamyl-tRNA(Gln) amidotransferase subunit A
MDADVRASVEAAVKKMEELGAEVDREVSLPSTGYALACYYIIAPSEAMANLARYDGVKYGYSDMRGDSMWQNMELTRQHGFGDEVKRRIMLGTYALSAGYYDAYYLKAQKVRTLIKQDFDEAFKNVDVIAAPTAPTTAFKIGEKAGDPLQMYLSDVFTLSASLAGIVGAVIPCGFDAAHLPVGLQIIGPAFDEPGVLRAAHAYQQSTDWHTRQTEL